MVSTITTSTAATYPANGTSCYVAVRQVGLSHSGLSAVCLRGSRGDHAPSLLPCCVLFVTEEKHNTGCSKEKEITPTDEIIIGNNV